MLWSFILNGMMVLFDSPRMFECNSIELFFKVSFSSRDLVFFRWITIFQHFLSIPFNCIINIECNYSVCCSYFEKIPFVAKRQEQVQISQISIWLRFGGSRNTNSSTVSSNITARCRLSLVWLNCFILDPFGT